MRSAVAVVLALLAAGGADRAAAQSPDALMARGVGEFRAGRISESLVAFDALAALVPSEAPQLWQRGIALYYAHRYQDCRRQFESHRLVNPGDVENAAWHFLCVARAESPVRARAALLPVREDRRVPMREIYQMFRGTMTPAQVLAAANNNDASAEFYARLYVGLYHEARGERTAAREQIAAAAADRFIDVGGYMNMVARVHLTLAP